jgi:hypothetical protein
MRIDSPLMTNAQATGSFSGSFTGTFDGDIQADSVAYANVNNKPSLVSGSIQIDHDAATNFVANEHIDHSSITIGSGKGMSGGGTIDTNRSLSLDTGSAHFQEGVEKYSTDFVLPAGVVSGSAQIDYASIQNQPTTISGAQASAIVTNSAKTGISSQQASDITANNAKVGITSSQASAITANSNKTGISSQQASDITTNNAKISYNSAASTKLGTIEENADVTDTVNVTAAGALMDSEVSNLAQVKAFDSSDYLASSTTTISSAQASAITANTAKTGITSGQASAITANTAKISYNSAASTKLGTIEENAQVNVVDSVAGKTGVVSLVKADVGLGNVTNESKATMFASPTFTGTPVSTTPADNDNSTKIATTAFVIREVSDIIGGAPAAFDTLSEISASIANGDSDVVALTSVVGTKLAKASNLSDLTNAGTARTNLGLGSAATTAASAYATSAQGTKADSAQQPPSEGAFANGDKTKLDGIEASANVTDAANVTAAGALMDSEVTNLSQVKAFDSSDYATSAQGTKADTAHGWGDHGTEGYTTYTSNQATNTSSAVNFSSVTATGDIVAYSSSDRRLKDNIKPIPDALLKIEQIGGYEFDWNNNQDTFEGHDIGVVAQEIEAIAPELVASRENGYKAVKYDKLTAILIQAVKELSAKVKELENK